MLVSRVRNETGVKPVFNTGGDPTVSTVKNAYF